MPMRVLNRATPRAPGPRRWEDLDRLHTPARLRALVEEVRRSAHGGGIGRVVDLGCARGRRSIALARAGFEVLGLETSIEPIRVARRRARDAGDRRVAFHVVDALGGEWPRVRARVVILSHWLDHRGGPHLRRLLRRVKGLLDRDGVLIIEPGECSSPFSAPAGELVATLKTAGFAVDRIAAGPRSTGDPRAWIVARPLITPPDSLAITAWGMPSECLLDLRYAPDEAALLDPSPREIWTRLVASREDAGADLAEHYPVDDPYGCRRGAPTVARHFGCRLALPQVTFAAGVTSLLHDLCGLAEGGVIVTRPDVHGDLEAWALARGMEVHRVEESGALGPLVEALRFIEPQLLHLDRPTFAGRVLATEEIEILARAMPPSGVVLIDESAAPYLGPSGSAIQTLGRVDNLVVLRGFTKAYSCGGLRVGFAVASRSIADRVRELVAPMQVGGLALQAALRLLEAGDVFRRLVERIRAAKPEVTAVLESAHFEVVPGHGDLPWIALSDRGGDTTRALTRRGVRVLHPTPSPLRGRGPELLRVTVPLSSERMECFMRLMGRGEGVRAGPVGPA